MTEEAMGSLAERRREAEQRASELERRPGVLQKQLHEAEAAGDVGSADELEKELAGLVGVTNAAKLRAVILVELHTKAVKEAERAAAQEAAEEVCRNAARARQMIDDPAALRQREAYLFEEAIRGAKELDRRVVTWAHCPGTVSVAIRKLRWLISSGATGAQIVEQFRAARDLADQWWFRRQAEGKPA